MSIALLQSVGGGGEEEAAKKREAEEQHQAIEAKVLYLLACLTMGVELLVPLARVSIANSKCLATSSSFSAEKDLRAFFEGFVREVLAVSGGAVSLLSRSLSPLSLSYLAGRSFFSTGGGINSTLFDVNVYPVLATGVVKPLDSVRRGMQAVPTAGDVGVKKSTTVASSSSSSSSLFISGKTAASQPLLCYLHGITHIVRCYAIPPEGEPFAATVSSGTATRRRATNGPLTTFTRSGGGATLPLSADSSLPPSLLPTDSDMLRAVFEKGGEWLVVPPPPLTAANPRPPTYRVDTLEFPMGMLRRRVCGGGGEEDSALSTAAASSCGDGDELGLRRLPTEVYSVQRLTIPAVDDDSYLVDSHFNDEVFAFISGAIAGGGKVLVHCSAGKHRSAAIVAAYLIDLEVPERRGVGDSHGTSLAPSPATVVERCYERIRSARPTAEPTMSYQRQLEGFAKAVLLGKRNNISHSDRDGSSHQLSEKQ